MTNEEIRQLWKEAGVRVIPLEDNPKEYRPYQISDEKRRLNSALALYPYEEDQEIEGLEKLSEKQPCYDCNRWCYHAYRYNPNSLIPICCDICNINLVLG